MPDPVNMQEKEDESIAQLIGDLANEVTDLVQEEVALAKAELSEKIVSAGMAAGMFSAAMVAGIMALGAATALAVIALSLVLDLWLAALIVTAGWLFVALIMIVTGGGKIKKAMPMKPEQTVQSIKEDAEWAKHPTRFGRK